MMKFPAAASVALFLAFAADPPTSLHTGEIVAHLARTIAWYRHVVAVEQSEKPPADLLVHDGPQRRHNARGGFFYGAYGYACH